MAEDRDTPPPPPGAKAMRQYGPWPNDQLGGEDHLKSRTTGRTSVVVYRFCTEHNHVEKGRRFSDGRVVITHPAELAESHAPQKGDG